MKIVKFVFLLFFFFSIRTAVAQPFFNNTQDSIRYFLDSAFFVIKNYGLHANRIDWDKDLKEFYQVGLSKKKFRDVLEVFPLVFDKMQDAHSVMWIDSTRYGSKTNWREKRAINPVLRNAYRNGHTILKAERLGEYGYIRIPYITIFEQNLQLKSKKSQEIQDMICAIYSPDIKGWIIDLRLDAGGDMYPMINGLYQFLGDGHFISFLNKNASTEKTILRQYGVYSDTSLQTRLLNPCLPDLSQAPVVVLVSQNTASSGELTALTFKGRNNTLFMGEKSGGLMTGNELYAMPFGENILPMGILLTLATSEEAGRDGKVVPFIYPDVEIPGGDNFNDLLIDEKIVKAIEWLSSRQTQKMGKK